MISLLNNNPIMKTQEKSYLPPRLYYFCVESLQMMAASKEPANGEAGFDNLQDGNDFEW